ncbi:MAG: ADP-ribosylglycohydrolase family protein [Ilumatobacteraceae bacterium]
MSNRPSNGYTQRAIGCIVGSAVGDALGAPFEFGPAGQYSKRFPRAVHGGIGEMVGGGGFGWAPGQFTDDTEMAVVVAESLLACDGLDADDQLARFRAWGAKAIDVGNLTRTVLMSGLPASEAAQSVVRSRHGRNTAGNGSLMRAAPGAVYFAGRGQQASAEAAVALSVVTHADPLCQWAVSIQHELVRILLSGGTLETALHSALGSLTPEALSVYTPLLDPSWRPSADAPGNGSAMGALAQAVWSMRRATSFADAITTVIDLGDDTDTVAAVTGTLAGAHFGIQAIPTRWLTYVHGLVTQLDGTARRYDHLDLQNLAMSLIGRSPAADVADEPSLAMSEVSAGLWATNRAGARSAPADAALISLCRIDDSMRHPVRREIFLIDNDAEHNPSLAVAVDDALDSIDALLAEGRQVVVHCHGGRSRTGLVLAAHLMRLGHSLEEATALLADRWPHAHTNNKAFAAELHRRSK